VDECPHVARRDSAAEGAVRGHGSEQEVYPIRRLPMLVELGLVEAAGVGVHPIVERLVHELTRAGRLEGEYPWVQGRRRLEQLQMIDRSVGVAGEP
jgi:hypothetical protein